MIKTSEERRIGILFGIPFLLFGDCMECFYNLIAVCFISGFSHVCCCLLVIPSRENILLATSLCFKDENWKGI